MLSLYAQRLRDGSTRSPWAASRARRPRADRAARIATPRGCPPAGGRPARALRLRDGIAQPGSPAPPASSAPDLQPEMPTGDLLLGRDYENSFGGNFAGSLPPALADNATYGAFRILRQNAGAFEGLLREWGAAAARGPRAHRGQAHGPLAQRRAARARPRTPTSRSPPCRATSSNEFDYVSPDERSPRASTTTARRAALPVRRPRAAPEPARGARSWASRTAGARAPEHALRSRARRRRDRRRRRRPRARRLLPVRRPRGAVRVPAARVGQQRLRRRRPAWHPRADHGQPARRRRDVHGASQRLAPADHAARAAQPSSPRAAAPTACCRASAACATSPHFTARSGGRHDHLDDSRRWRTRSVRCSLRPTEQSCPAACSRGGGTPTSRRAPRPLRP